MSKVLRIRFPDGQTRRLTLNPHDTLQTLSSSVHTFDKLSPPYKYYRDPRHQHPIDPLHASHGDIIYVTGVSIVDLTSDDVPVNSTSKEKGENDENVENEWGLRCLHGPRGMCARCAPRETPEERLTRAESEWKNKGGLRGMTVGVLEAREAMTPQIKVEKGGDVSVKIDQGCGFGFQHYLASIGFSQQRLGVLYGRKDDEDIEVEVVYEPQQWGSEETYQAKGFAGDEQDEEREKVETLNGLLGLEEVGIVISARPRKCLLSGKDIVVAVQEAVKRERDSFVVLLMSRAEDGKTMFEAFRLSKQALLLYKKGFFAPSDQQKPNKGRVLMQKPVLVEGKETKKVHTEFFLVNVPIRTTNGRFRHKFPIENRELEPQNGAALKDAIKDQDAPYWKRLADWHLLLFLARMLDMKADMPALVQPILQQREFAPQEEGFKQLIEAIAAAG